MQGVDPSQLTVLLIEDNQHFRLLLRTVLQTAGIQSVLEARDGVEGLRLLADTPVDIVLADWKMEPMDGILFVHRIRRSEASPNPFLPILMISAYFDHGSVNEARDAGVDACIPKPITARTVLAAIREVVLNRPRFVRSNGYFGPDRRRAAVAFEGDDRRKQPPCFVEPPPLALSSVMG